MPVAEVTTVKVCDFVGGYENSMRLVETMECGI